MSQRSSNPVGRTVMHHGLTRRFAKQVPAWSLVLLLASACSAESDKPVRDEAAPIIRHHMALALPESPMERVFVAAHRPSPMLVELDLWTPDGLSRLSGLRVCWQGRRDVDDSSCLDVLAYGRSPLRVVSSRRSTTFTTDDHDLSGSCSAAQLERNATTTNRLVYRLAMVPEASVPGLAHCPLGFDEHDERVGEATVRTCSRPTPKSRVWTARDQEMFAVEHVAGRIDWVWVYLEGELPSEEGPRPLANSCLPYLSSSWVRPRVRYNAAVELLWTRGPPTEPLASPPTTTKASAQGAGPTNDGAPARLFGLQYYVDGVRNGPYVEVWPDGTPALIGDYVDDQPHGLWVWIDPRGKAFEARTFVFGVITGTPEVSTIDTDRTVWP